MSYISLSEKDKKEMLAKIGISSVDELFQCIPDDLKFKQKLDVPEALTEPELTRQIEEVASQNSYHLFLSFLGAGAYSHVIPSVVDYLSSRGEFISPYTPYQPEVSQGTLQIIFEFQTLICQLTGMDIANASLYDGASGAAEAALMAHRLKSKPNILVAKSIHPQYREVIQTYTRNLNVSVEEIPYSDRGEVAFEDLKASCRSDRDYQDMIVHLYPVPEPASFMLLGIGLMGAGIFKRKKKKKFQNRFSLWEVLRCEKLCYV